MKDGREGPSPAGAGPSGAASGDPPLGSQVGVGTGTGTMPHCDTSRASAGIGRADVGCGVGIKP